MYNDVHFRASSTFCPEVYKKIFRESELVGIDETLGPVLENTIHASIDRLEAVLKTAAANGAIKNDGHLREKALALQNLLIGLSVLSRVVHSEKELFSVTKQTLKGLDLYDESPSPALHQASTQ
ncbi:hypothetical protein MNBD_GAMMA13-1122 [hydrothermal vent metagenome]|uniref:Transcriptional regulator, TetR family n=1 Tax=hydrothermal vent metagenome TaxID=652676 RepID=A0A3B0Y8E9_9ZZZZ